MDASFDVEGFIRYLAMGIYINTWTTIVLQRPGIFVLYGDKTTNDTMDPDPMGLAGYERPHFFDKTKNVLEQLQIGYSGYEVE